MDRLTALDASFLWFEHPGVPMHVGAVATFESAPLVDGRGRLRLRELQDLLVARLGAVPRLRRRLAPVPFGIDRPCWVDDPGFDVTRHVGEIRLGPRADDAGLLRLAAALLSEVLPRDRPLWDLHFVTGLSGGRVGLVERVHHALVDGVSGVDLAALLLDLSPDAPRPAPPAPWRPPRPPSPIDLVAAGVRERLGGWGGFAGITRRPGQLARAVATVAGALGTLVGDGLTAPRSSLNAQVAGARRLAVVRADLATARAAGAGSDATVNDVVLAAVAGGLRRLLLGRREVVPADLTFKVLVPVSLRRPDEHGTLGNRVGAICAPLPVGIGDPIARLLAVAATMRRLKARPLAASTGLLLDAANALPAGAGGLLTRALGRQRLVNLVVTNVPGSPVPLYLAGARLLDAYPVVPLAANLSVGVAVMSYDGQLTLTLTADERACPDVDVFAAGIERSLAQLGVAGPHDRCADDGERAVHQPAMS
jgi:WS/DGAT/MGAT family acyltransferase